MQQQQNHLYPNTAPVAALCPNAQAAADQVAHRVNDAYAATRAHMDATRAQANLASQQFLNAAKSGVATVLRPRGPGFPPILGGLRRLQ